jgi:hypothetical protein
MKTHRFRILSLILSLLVLVWVSETKAQNKSIQDPDTPRMRAEQQETPPVVFGTNATYGGDGYLTAGELWETVRPPNGTSPRETTPTKYLMAILGCGQGGAAWREPTALWPGGWFWTNIWRSGTWMCIGAYDNDTTFNPARMGGAANPSHTTDFIGPGGVNLGNNYALARYAKTLQGAVASPVGATGRDYIKLARWVDPVTGQDEGTVAGSNKRAMMVYEFGYPTTIGVDVKWRARQYTMNWQNMNDFLVNEVVLTNTGNVDINADGTYEKTNHKIQGLTFGLWTLPGIAVRIGISGTRQSNDFGALRGYGYVGDNDPKTGVPTAALIDFPGINPVNYLSDKTVPSGQGKRDMGLNSYGNKNYTEVWNGFQFMGVKQGDAIAGTTGKYSGADKLTTFGSHPIGTGAQRGWYTSSVDAAKFWADVVDPRKFFLNCTATWRNDWGREDDATNTNTAINPSYFASGTGEDITTWVPKASPGRPDGDWKFAGFNGGYSFPPYENGWTQGFAAQEDFNGDMFYGIGPFSLNVGESITIMFVEVAGYRLQGIQGALRGADYAWQNNWNVFSQLPNAPDIKVENTQRGSVIVRWTDSPTADGFKVWKASQYKKLRYQDLGIRLVDRYQEQKTVGQDISSLLQPMNPNFDAFNLIKTEQGYQPDGWGTYDLVAVIPRSELSQYADASVPGFQYAYEDKGTILGFGYWYYVSAYKNGTFTGPVGTSTDQIETSNFTRNGRDGFWKGAYPYATQDPSFPAATDVVAQQRIGAMFTATPPVATVQQLNSQSLKVSVRPNPYKRAAYFDNRQTPFDHKVAFYNLPTNCKITIVSITGQIIDQIQITGATNGLYFWNMFSKDGIEVASGLYIYLVEWDGGSTRGYLSILR